MNTFEEQHLLSVFLKAMAQKVTSSMEDGILGWDFLMKDCP